MLERVPIHGFSGGTRRGSTARSSSFADVSTLLLCFGAGEIREASSTREVRRGCERIESCSRRACMTARRDRIRFVTSHERGATRAHATAESRGHRCPCSSSAPAEDEKGRNESIFALVRSRVVVSVIDRPGDAMNPDEAIGTERARG